MSVYKCSFSIYIIFYHRRPFNKTAATLVRPHPFSTLCTTPLGKLMLWEMVTHDSDQATLHFTHPCILETQFGVLIVHGCQPVTVGNGSRSPSHPHNTFLVTFTQSSLIRNNLFLEDEMEGAIPQLSFLNRFYFIHNIFIEQKLYKSITNETSR